MSIVSDNHVILFKDKKEVLQSTGKIENDKYETLLNENFIKHSFVTTLEFSFGDQGSQKENYDKFKQVHNYSVLIFTSAMGVRACVDVCKNNSEDGNIPECMLNFPCFTVGPATAAAAIIAGFKKVVLPDCDDGNAIALSDYLKTFLEKQTIWPENENDTKKTVIVNMVDPVTYIPSHVSMTIDTCKPVLALLSAIRIPTLKNRLTSDDYAYEECMIYHTYPKTNLFKDLLSIYDSLVTVDMNTLANSPFTLVLFSPSNVTAIENHINTITQYIPSKDNENNDMMEKIKYLLLKSEYIAIGKTTAQAIHNLNEKLSLQNITLNDFPRDKATSTSISLSLVGTCQTPTPIGVLDALNLLK